MSNNEYPMANAEVRKQPAEDIAKRFLALLGMRLMNDEFGLTGALVLVMVRIANRNNYSLFILRLLQNRG